MSITLTFAAADVRKLIDHTLDSEFHRPTIAQRLELYGPEAWEKQPSENIETPPGLWLVKDDGIYLMSNGHPGFRTDNGERHYVVYAEGYDPRTDPEVWLRSRDAVGGDDFCESIICDWDLLFLPGDQYLYITVDNQRFTMSAAPPPYPEETEAPES